MQLIHRIAENKIKTAIARGELDNLPGQGKPMVLDNNAMVPAHLRAGYRMLKNAGVLPIELMQRKEIAEIEQAIARADSKQKKQQLLVKLSLLNSRQREKM